jgi:hypothetical protein
MAVPEQLRDTLKSYYRDINQCIIIDQSDGRSAASAGFFHAVPSLGDPLKIEGSPAIRPVSAWPM